MFDRLLLGKPSDSTWLKECLEAIGCERGSFVEQRSHYGFAPLSNRVLCEVGEFPQDTHAHVGVVAGKSDQ